MALWGHIGEATAAGYAEGHDTCGPPNGLTIETVIGQRHGIGERRRWGQSPPPRKLEQTGEKADPVTQVQGQKDDWKKTQMRETAFGGHAR